MKSWICTTLTQFLAPTQGAARLNGYLKQEGHDVGYLDFNQDLYFWMLSPENLQSALQKLARNNSGVYHQQAVGAILNSQSRGMLRRLAAEQSMDWVSALANGDDQHPLRDLAVEALRSAKNEGSTLEALLGSGNHVLTEIEKSRAALKESFLRLPTQEFVSHFLTLMCGKAMLNAVHYPMHLDFGFGFQNYEFPLTEQGILASIKSERHNYLLPYYRNEVLPRLEAEGPSVVGISITHNTEIVPALTLADLIRAKHPEVHISLGGAAATDFSRNLPDQQGLWHLFDSVVAGPGEEPFSELLDAVESGAAIEKIPNVFSVKDGGLSKPAEYRDFDLNKACTPDYGDLLPGTPVPLETASDCYWGKCIFCYYPKHGQADPTLATSRRVRDTDKVLQDFETLRDRHDPSFIILTDSAVPPPRMEALADHNIASERPMPFSAFFRLEKEFAAPEFCAKLAKGGFLGGQAGLESGSQRMNNVINKGVTLENAGKVVSNFFEAGISTHMYSMVGLPGETADDAIMTFEFLDRYGREIDHDWQVYPMGIQDNTPLGEHAEKWNVERVEGSKDSLVGSQTTYVLKDTVNGALVSACFKEQLKKHLHPLAAIMDVELYKVFLAAQKAHGLSTAEVAEILEGCLPDWRTWL